MNPSSETPGHFVSVLEIAFRYFPYAKNKQSARNLLMHFIRHDPELHKELIRLGFRKGQRLFSPIQLATLIDHFGAYGSFQRCKNSSRTNLTVS